MKLRLSAFARDVQNDRRRTAPRGHGGRAVRSSIASFRISTNRRASGRQPFAARRSNHCEASKTPSSSTRIAHHDSKNPPLDFRRLWRLVIFRAVSPPTQDARNRPGLIVRDSVRRLKVIGELDLPHGLRAKLIGDGVPRAECSPSAADGDDSE